MKIKERGTAKVHDGYDFDACFQCNLKATD